MAHLENINITGLFRLTNRGPVLTTELDYDLEHSKFSKGDTIVHDKKYYKVKSIEALYARTKTGIMADYVSFVVEEITVVDFLQLRGIISGKHSKWLEEAKWRERNEWWISPWQKVQIIYYCRIKPLFKK